MNFEQYLINKGFVRFSLNAKTMKFYEPTEYIISTMVNLCHYYYPKNDPIIDKINQDIGISKTGITWDDRKNEIVIGLHEANKPVTLICPRPRIRIYKDNFTDDETSDDSMNIILKHYTNDQIFEAMYNKDILLEFVTN